VKPKVPNLKTCFDQQHFFSKKQALEVCLLVPKAYTRPSRAYWHLQGTYQAEWNVFTCVITPMNTHVLWCYCTRICVFSGRQWARLQQAGMRVQDPQHLPESSACHPPTMCRGVGGPARRGDFFAALLAIRPNPPFRVRISKNKQRHDKAGVVPGTRRSGTQPRSGPD